MSKILTIVAVTALMVTSVSAVSTGICKGCHGPSWEKKAMGKAKVLKNMTKAEILKALKGYKAGTYGGPMKGLMKAQLAKYKAKDLEAIATEIKK